jgi:hypothetical protein
LGLSKKDATGGSLAYAVVLHERKKPRGIFYLGLLALARFETFKPSAFPKDCRKKPPANSEYFS